MRSIHLVPALLAVPTEMKEDTLGVPDGLVDGLMNALPALHETASL